MKEVKAMYRPHTILAQGSISIEGILQRSSPEIAAANRDLHAAPHWDLIHRLTPT
jgi:hypothetical protein